MDFESLSADLVSHPITGYLPDRRYIDLPLISHIKDNFYVGGYQDVDLGDFFSHIFSLYQWKKYRFGPDTVLVAREMYDTPDLVDVETVEEVSDLIVEALKTGGNVLSQCQAGINRSNLIATRVLMKHYNMTAVEAIELLRKQRGELVLANKTFEGWLLSHDESVEEDWVLVGETNFSQLWLGASGRMH